MSLEIGYMIRYLVVYLVVCALHTRVLHIHILRVVYTHVPAVRNLARV
jgi:hypothetical protein